MLLERGRELQAIDAALATAAAGSGAGLLVVGDAGIGKSALVGEAARRAAAQGFRVLSARGGELTQTLAPFGETEEAERALEGALRDRPDDPEDVLALEADLLGLALFTGRPLRARAPLAACGRRARGCHGG